MARIQRNTPETKHQLKEQRVGLNGAFVREKWANISMRTGSHCGLNDNSENGDKLSGKGSFHSRKGVKKGSRGKNY